jgi:hypothetical protein
MLYFRRYTPDFSHVIYPLSSFYPFNSEDNYTKTIGCCDGILCLIHRNYSFTIENLIQLALWNPSTRKYNALPSLDKPPQPNDGKNRFVDTLYGFGYDYFSDKYKVVAVFMYKCKGDSSYVYKTQAKVHTSGIDSWILDLEHL